MKRFGTKNLKEGYAWERKADGTLPTLKDATKQHESNIKEQASRYKYLKGKNNPFYGDNFMGPDHAQLAQQLKGAPGLEDWYRSKEGPYEERNVDIKIVPANTASGQIVLFMKGKKLLCVYEDSGKC